MTRILLVSLQGAVGGGEKSLLLLVRYLGGEFRTIAACPCPSALSESLGSAGVDCCRLPRPPKRAFSSPLSLFYWLRTAVCLVIISVRTNPDIIHANSLHAGLASVLAAVVTGKRLLLHVRDLSGLGVVVRLVGRFSNKVVAVSRAVKNWLVEQGIRAERIEVVYNGVDGALAPVANLNENPSASLDAGRAAPFCFAHVAQFVPWKNQIAFLEAASYMAYDCPTARFALVGDDVFGRDRSYRGAVLSYARNSAISDRVDFLGWRENMGDVWPGIDCLVHTATREPFGRVIIEAMAHRIPVIAVDACGPGEIIQDGRTGILVRAGDVRGLSQAMLRIARDADFARGLAEAGWKQAVSDFPADKTAAHIRRIYREVLTL